jgi:hypothetical protein
MITASRRHAVKMRHSTGAPSYRQAAGAGKAAGARFLFFAAAKVRGLFQAAALACFICICPPVHAGVIVSGGLTHEKEALPGESYSDKIEIQNVEDTPQEVKIYQTDYFFYADGRIIYGDPGKLARSNAHWISYSPKRLTVPPHDTVAVHYTVQVPDDKSLKGTYWSIIMVETVPPESPESSTHNPEHVELGVHQLFRFGIQIITDIGDTGARNIKFQETKLLKQDGKQFLQLDIANTGERWLRATLWAELYDEQGNYTGRFEGGKLRIYPGTSVRFKVDLSSVPNNTYKSLIVIDCGGDYVFGANMTLVIK